MNFWSCGALSHAVFSDQGAVEEVAGVELDARFAGVDAQCSTAVLLEHSRGSLGR